LSADGQTALIGGSSDSAKVGAAWVFKREGSLWVQGQKLTGGEEVPPGKFGSATALSSDGTTALVGGWKDNEEAGAGWVFTREGETWTQQGPKLTGLEPKPKRLMGTAAALSAD